MSILNYIESKLIGQPTRKISKPKESSSKSSINYYQTDDEDDEDEIEDELKAYDWRQFSKGEKETENVIKFWKDIGGNLSKFAINMLSCPASSVAIESHFSGCSFVMNKQRSSILPEKLEDLQFIKSNKDLF